MGAACCTNDDTPGKTGCCRRAAAAEETDESAALIAQEDVGAGKVDELEDLRKEAARLDRQRAADAAAGPPSAVEGVRAALAAAEARALASQQMQLGPAKDPAPIVAAPAILTNQFPQVAASTMDADVQRSERKHSTSPAMQFEVSWDGKGYVGKSDSTSKRGGNLANGADTDGMTGIEEGSSEEEDEPPATSTKMPNTSSMIPEHELADGSEPEASPAPEAKPAKKRRTWSFSFRRKSVR